SFLSDGLADRITITGARAATEYGTNVAAHLAGELARDEPTIASAGAYGVDGAAHQAALAAGGNTIAILAGGVDRPYPRGHADLLARIGHVGLLASETAPGATPTRYRFMARARLLGTLSGARVIPEASFRSGSLLVPAEAHRHGRAVGAVPGPVTSVTSMGPHELIKRGVGHVVSDTADVRGTLDSLGDPAWLLNREPRAAAAPEPGDACLPARRPGLRTATAARSSPVARLRAASEPQSQLRPRRLDGGWSAPCRRERISLMNNTDVERPEWLDEPCPAWCHGDHSGQDFEADRKHLSETVTVPVITHGRAPRWRHLPGDVV